jgi:hypothetical protein
MLSHEFTAELGAFIRQLEAQIRKHPELTHSDSEDALENLDRAIVSLIAVRMKMRASLYDK